MKAKIDMVTTEQLSHTHTHTHTHTPRRTAALFTVANRWKQTRCPSKDELINKMWSINAIKYCSVFKEKEILSHAVICMNLADIMLSEISQF